MCRARALFLGVVNYSGALMALENARPVSFLERAARVLIMAGRNELLRADVGRDILMLPQAVLRDWGRQKGGSRKQNDSIGGEEEEEKERVAVTSLPC